MGSHIVRRFLPPLAWAILILVVCAFPARASQGYAPLDHGDVTLRLYGAFTPGVVSSNNESGSWWGYGGALQYGMNGRWRLSLDASRLTIKGKSISPFLAGVSYGPPGGRSALRPWVEIGAGYYRQTSPAAYNVALGASGNSRDQFSRPMLGPSGSRSEAVGGYFGAGLDLALSSRLGLGLGVRGHNWVELPVESHRWNGMLMFRSGLSLRF